MSLDVRRRMNRFMWRGAGQIEGWLNSRCARAVVALAQAQAELGVRGAVGEIGVYAGRLFILMKLSGAQDDPCFAIDLFRSQTPTDGGPQCGSAKEFLANVERWTGSAKNVLVLEQPSQTVTAEQVLDACGPARLLSIDWGAYLRGCDQRPYTRRKAYSPRRRCNDRRHVQS